MAAAAAAAVQGPVVEVACKVKMSMKTLQTARSGAATEAHAAPLAGARLGR